MNYFKSIVSSFLMETITTASVVAKELHLPIQQVEDIIKQMEKEQKIKMVKIGDCPLTGTDCTRYYTSNTHFFIDPILGPDDIFF